MDSFLLNQWKTASIDFDYDGAHMIEFRTFAEVLDPGEIVIDTITAEKL